MRRIGALVVSLAVSLLVVWGLVACGPPEAPVARSYSIQTTNGYSTKNVTVSSTAITISHSSWGWGSSDVGDAEKAVISAHTQGVVLTWDGTTVSTTLGLPLTANSTVEIVGTGNIANLQFIRSGGSDATVSVTLEK